MKIALTLDGCELDLPYLANWVIFNCCGFFMLIREQGNVGQVIYCLTKAIKADPEDVDAKWDRASLFAGRNEYAKAAESFEQILLQRPSDVEVCKMVSKMYHKTGQLDRATQALEKLIEEHPTEADMTAVNLLAELHMESGAFATAIAHIDHARTIYCSDLGLPLDLAIKAGICHAYLGNLEDAEVSNKTSL
jgi:general transcription factor 3C polypeptide 3 (transcription factor C subunit 4)